MITNSSNNNRSTELDFVRAIAVVAVIAIHVTSITLTKTSPDPFTLVLSMILNQLSRFCVPAFLFVSGVLAFHSYKRNNYYLLLKGKIKALIIPYLVWTILGLLFFLTYSTNYKGIIMIFLTGNGPFYQLYYIPLLFQMFIILPLMMKLIFSKKIVIIMSSLTIILFICYQTLLMGVVLPNDLSGSANSILQSTFIVWVTYFSLGIYAAQNYSKLLEFMKTKSTVAFVAIYVISAMALVIDAYVGFVTLKQIELLSYYRVTVFIYSFASIALLIKLGMKYKWKALSNLYKNSFGVYLIHVAILKIIFLITSMLFSNMLFITLSIFLTTFISYWIVEIIKMTPISSLLLGQKYTSTRRRASMKPLQKELER